MEGTAAIRMDFEQFFETQKPDGGGVIRGVEVGEDWAYMWGTWSDNATLKATGESQEESGKWISVLRNTPQGWRFYIDLWNRDA